MKKFKLISLLLAIILAFGAFAPSALALDEPRADDAEAIILADAKTGKILYSREATAQRSPASLTKIMTVLLAVEAVERGEIDLEEMVTADNDCRQGLGEDSSTCGILPGEAMSFKDLLYCAMVHSANEACNIIATRVSGSISAFVELMNTRAAQLGCSSTHFADTNGLSNENHYSTAYDLFVMTQEAVKHDLFFTIANTVHYETAATNLSAPRKLDNSNALLTNDSIYSVNGGYLYPGAAGVKTGYTRAAGYCLISTAEKNGVKLLAVVMGCDGTLNSSSTDYGNFLDSVHLYDWGFENFAYRDLLSADTVLERRSVELAEDGGTVSLRAKEGANMLLAKDVTDADIEVKVNIKEDQLVAPIEAGQVLGSVEVTVRGETVHITELISNNSVSLSRAEVLKRNIRETLSKGWVKAAIIICIVFLVLYLALVISYRRRRRQYLKQRRINEMKRRQERERRMEEERRAQIPDFELFSDDEIRH